MKLRSLALALAAIVALAPVLPAADVHTRPAQALQFGTAAPTGDCKVTGSYYIRTSNSTVYFCVGDTWTLFGNGVADGASGRVQVSAGSGALTSDSDLTFATDTLIVTKLSTTEESVTGSQGGKFVEGIVSEELTLDTGAAFTDTVANLLPADSVILAVTYRVTTSITTAANFTIGISGTANRFCTTQSTLTAGTTGVCLAHTGPDNSGPLVLQAAAAKVRVTLNTTPGAGAIRLQVHYRTFTPPTS